MSICFFISDSSPGKTMSPIGKLGENIDSLKEIIPGDIFLLYEETG